MPTFENPAVDATEAEQALRGLVHATRRIDAPSQIYGVLGSLSQAVASLSQALHQIGSFHDEHGARTDATIIDPRQTGAAYRASWDLHRAAEMLTSVGKSIDSAHTSEATIIYQPRHLAAPSHGHATNEFSL
ncbi:hypothetical protein C6I20_07775 [Aeromicrobium sp. A1-2]|uniref:hypothetical protein n=1 Tax=Aeromicrobium sp. A1-2 TaxID=2107713 RepID=UPI000E46CA15|nr:hypothetical protein [Aeromicrobium sp. A1-2]AXT85092.1 hypothetical protein C6I20_07775 [Aeromicrobium sp. A1-2]